MEASVIDVVLAGGRKVPAEIVGYDHESGLGVLRALAPLEVAPVALGTAAGLGVSRQVLIANRLGIEGAQRSEEHTSELQSLMRISYAVFCLKKKQTKKSEQQS